MKIKRLLPIALAMALCLSATAYQTQAQEPAAKKGKSQTVAPQAGSSPVIGSGTPGRLSKWTGVSGTETYSIGNSNIFEDKFGRISIGTDIPTSKLTVAGVIESTSGGVKFPDGTVQTTSAAGALVTVAHDATLTGNGTQASPLGVASPLLVRDLDNPARQPVQEDGLCLVNQSGCGGTILTVPAGKRLVIEYVSMGTLIDTSGVAAIFTLSTTVNGKFMIHRFPLTQPSVTPAGGGSRITAMAQQVRIYADPETSVHYFGQVTVAVTGNLTFTISGYYVDIP